MRHPGLGKPVDGLRANAVAAHDDDLGAGRTARRAAT
jgi:hypothetical protein